jgi:hypothetical protein
MTKLLEVTLKLEDGYMTAEIYEPESGEFSRVISNTASEAGMRVFSHRIAGEFLWWADQMEHELKGE